MADNEKTPPAASSSSPATPDAKRVRTNSPPKSTEAGSPTNASNSARPVASAIAEMAPLPEDGAEIEAEADGDSAFGTDNSDTTSIASSIYEGYVENGRRYQALREGEYWGPSDEKQFESMHSAHIMSLILDQGKLFRAPIPETAQNILDIGTGSGIWAVDVADRLPYVTVQGTDLYPPPETWVPPNCIFTVDDVLKPWMFQQKFDLIHLRWLYGAFTDSQWTGVYKQAYQNLLPGGWIEQVEPSITFHSDDGTLPSDSLMANWGPMFIELCARAGKPLDTSDTFKSRIEAHGGFTNIHTKEYKVPFGSWAKHPVLKEAGRINKEQLMTGMEGYTMFLLTHFGKPTPWSPEEVQVYLAKCRKEMNSGWHTYLILRRVWAQKPYDAEKAE